MMGDPPQKVRVLHHDARGGLITQRPEPLETICQALIPAQCEPHALRIRADHGAVLRVYPRGKEHAPPLLLCHVQRHDDRLRRGGGAVIVGRVGNLHPREARNHALVFEDGLQRALADLRLIRGVGCCKLGARNHGVHHGRYEVLVGAPAQERRGHAPLRVPPGQCSPSHSELPARKEPREDRGGGNDALSARREKAPQEKRHQRLRACARGRRPCWG